MPVNLNRALLLVRCAEVLVSSNALCAIVTISAMRALSEV